MSVVGLQTSVWHNRMLLTYLFLLMPTLVIGSLFLVFFLLHGGLNEAFFSDFTIIAGGGLLLLSIWMVVGIYFQRQMLFSFTHTVELQRKDNPEVYNIVENLCIAQGISNPKVGIIETPALNAYATGWNRDDSWIVFTRGLIDTLNKEELEAVAAHELSHILNGDVKKLIVVNVFIGAIATIGYYMMKMRSKNSNGKGSIFPLIGMVLYALSIVALPLVHFTISRKKELLADAGSTQLTQNNAPLISALEKISKNPKLEIMDSKGSTLASMFIDNPKEDPRYMKKIRGLFATHPSMEKRIALLKKY